MITRRLKILTWQVHGNYMFYLSHANVDFYLPTKSSGEGYGGRSPGFTWGKNVHDIPAEQVKDLQLDCILFQTEKNYLHDQYEILSEAQRRLPRIFLEHNPPRTHPTDAKHVVDDSTVLLVHVTDFNNLMWDNNRTPTKVIDHGVVVPAEVYYTGQIPKGLVVVNGMQRRGRLAGLDILEAVRRQIPLDIVGMESQEVGGLGEISHAELPAFMAKYRFFFNPIRYTSLGLAVCEAMTLGLPIIGLATTEIVTVIHNGYNGFIETDVQKLIPHARHLLDNPAYAHQLSQNAALYAAQRFNIHRFARDWEKIFHQVADIKL
jgi:hypothetical protein